LDLAEAPVIFSTHTPEDQLVDGIGEGPFQVVLGLGGEVLTQTEEFAGNGRSTSRISSFWPECPPLKSHWHKSLVQKKSFPVVKHKR